MQKFYGQFDPPVDCFIFQRYFPEENIGGVFVECGAAGGLVESSCKFFEESMGWKGYNIEPAPPNFKTLCENRPYSTNLQLGLSNYDGKATFTHAISPVWGADFGNGSISHTQGHMKDLQEQGCSFIEYEIEVMTWRSFIQRESITHVDLFVLDVEGHELSVLEGMLGSAVLPDIMCVEVGHLNMHHVREKMAQLGYVYDISSHVNAFFIHTDKVGLFALRRATSHLSAKTEVDSLKSRVADLEFHIAEIYRSKAWRVAQGLRDVKKFFSFGKRQ